MTTQGFAAGVAVVVTFFATFFTSIHAKAFSFSPSEMEFLLGDSQLSRTFTAENPSDSKVAIQVSVHSRVSDVDGAEDLAETGHFSIFPKQIVLNPKESRAVRITYVGPKKIDREASYRVIAEQLPVELKNVKPAEGMNLKFLIKYQTSVYVKPPGATAQLLIESAKAIEHKDPKGAAPQLELFVRNDGGAHAILKGRRLRLKPISTDATTGKDKSKEKGLVLSDDAVRPFDSINVLAKSRRRVLLPWPKELPVQPVSAAFETD